MDILRVIRAAVSRSQGDTHGGGPPSDKPSGPPPKYQLPNENSFYRYFFVMMSRLRERLLAAFRQILVNHVGGGSGDVGVPLVCHLPR